MFWKKTKKTDTIEKSNGIDHAKDKTNNCHVKYAKLDIRRAVLDWRDTHIENVELQLASDLSRLYSELDQKTENMSVKHLFRQKKYGKEQVDPIFMKWVKSEEDAIIRKAQQDLSAVFAYALNVGDQSVALNHDKSGVPYTDILIAVSAAGAGLATISAVVASSVIPVAGIMGLFGVSMIVWHNVAIGGLLAVILLAIGAYKAASFRSRAVSRYRKRIRNAIEEKVLGYGSKNESICQRLQSIIEQAAEKILLEIDQC